MKKSKYLLVIFTALLVISVIFVPTGYIYGSSIEASAATASWQSNIDDLAIRIEHSSLRSQ